jgi:hypothetical protein
MTEGSPADAAGVDPRYEPGPDIGPLVRGLGGGLVAVLTLWVLDALWAGPLLVPNGAGEAEAVRATWPVLVASALGLGPSAPMGAAAMAAGGALAGLMFAFGRFRRFFPGASWRAGAAWGFALAVVTTPALASAGAMWISRDDPVATLLAAAQLLVEIVVGLVAYGAVLGWTNPRTHAS